MGMGPGGMGMGMGMGGGDMQAQMMQAQQQLMSNPELMRQVTTTPSLPSHPSLPPPYTILSLSLSSPTADGESADAEHAGQP